MITDLQLVEYPLTSRAWNYVSRRYVIFQTTLKYLRANFDAEFLDFSEGLLKIVDSPNGRVEKALDGFIRYSNEYLVLQARLNRDGKYLHSSYAEVNRAVYQSEIMNQYYLDGLFLSQALWPNHYRMIRYFRQYERVTNPDSKLLDVPTGPGIYSLLIARHFQFARLDSMDISAASIEYTRRVLATARPKGELRCHVGDIFESGDPPYDFICCGELLEHLEDPRAMLARLKDLLKPGGTLFLTTAIYAAAIDHIYLLKNVSETRDLLRDYFTIESELILPVNLSEYREDMDRVPINYACLLK